MERELKERIKEKVTNMSEYISYNMTRGSFANDICTSVAIEIIKEEDDYKEQLNGRMLQYAIGENLDIAATDKGFSRLPARKATGIVKITGTNGTTIKAGYIVVNSNNSCEYKVLEDKVIQNISANVEVECTKAGTIGNCKVGQINQFAKEYPGLSKVENEVEFDSGKDIESDESLRERVLERIRYPRMSWNKYVFEDVAKQVDKVVLAHCIPRANGAGTVKIIITEEGQETAQEELIEKVKNYIEATIISDITVTVEAVVVKNVDVVLKATISGDFNEEAAKDRIKSELNNFFDKNIFKDKLNYFDLVEVVQHSGCVLQIKDLTFDGTKNDIQLDENKLCKVNNLTLTIK